MSKKQDKVIGLKQPNITNTPVTTNKTVTVASTLAKTLTPEEKQADIELQRIIAAQLVDNMIYDSPEKQFVKDVTYVTASNGLFKVTKTAVALFKKQIQAYSPELSHLYPMTEGFELLVPKIPMKYIIQVLSYYRKVNVKDKTEASVLFFWNHTDDLDFTGELSDIATLPGLTVDGRLLIYCPRQKNSGTLSDFEADPWVNWFRNHTTCFLETHSH